MPSSPTPRLLIGLAATLIGVAVFCLYSLRQLDGLRQLQTDRIDRVRADSRQLLRVQEGLQQAGVCMNDMAARRTPAHGGTWRDEFAKIRKGIDAALSSGTRRDALSSSIDDLWEGLEVAAELAGGERHSEASRLVLERLESQHHSIAAEAGQMVARNQELEEAAAQEIVRIYDRSERNIYLFAVAMLSCVTAIGTVVLQDVRRLFAGLAAVSEQRRTLAQRLLQAQEESLRAISRDLHDDFGQVLTAVGALLRRVGKKNTEPDSALRKDLNEVVEIVQETLDRTRSLSQSLHPAVLDDHGLEHAIDRYLPMFQRQTGIPVRLEREGSGHVPERQAIHVYRVLQEALTNVAKHSNASEAKVRLRFGRGSMELQVEDDGVGIKGRSEAGLGMVAMRERAGLAGGELRVSSAASGGTLVQLDIPIDDHS